MELEFVSSRPLPVPTVTYYKNGYLGISNDASALMGIDRNSYVAAALDKQQAGNHSTVYLQVDAKPSPSTMRVVRYGEGNSLAIRFSGIMAMLDKQYKKFQVQKVEYNGEPIFKLEPIEQPEEKTHE